MTLPNGAAGVSSQSLRFGTGPGGADTVGFEGREEDAIKSILKAQKKPGIDSAFGGFNGGLISVLTRVFTGQGGGILASGLQFLAGLFNLRWAQVDQVETTADAAIIAANEANNTVKALLNGGIRTIYTSNFTYVKPPNLVKLIVIIFNGGGAGSYGSYNGPGGIGGGYIAQEFAGTVVPSSVIGTVAAGRSGGGGANQANNPSSFGSLLIGASTNKGAIVSSSGPLDATPASPGSGGRSGINNDSPNGTDGGSSILAAGGLGGDGARIAGQPGANAPTDREYLAGGGGGGGGRALSAVGSASGPGGAGGFPGGGGGGGGRDSFSFYTGGAGAPGLIALIEFLS